MITPTRSLKFMERVRMRRDDHWRYHGRVCWGGAKETMSSLGYMVRERDGKRVLVKAVRRDVPVYAWRLIMQSATVAPRVIDADDDLIAFKVVGDCLTSIKGEPLYGNLADIVRVGFIIWQQGALHHNLKDVCFI